MFCPNCGRENSNDKDVCAYCGRNINNNNTNNESPYSQAGAIHQDSMFQNNFVYDKNNHQK